MASVSNLRINAIVNDQATAPLKRINGALRTLGQGQSAATKGVSGFAESLTGAASSGGMAAFGIGVAATAVVAIGAAAVAAGIRAGKAASAFNEAANKVDVLFGNSAEAVKSFADTASDALGVTATEALSAAGSYGAMFRALGIAEGQAADMSVALTKLAGDMASFSNADPTEMLQKLQSGLSGESEPLRKYGVFLNEATVQAEAFRETGKRKATELTESEKVLARYNLILQQTAQQQGDLARTADSPANAIRRISATIEDTFRIAGEALLPEIEPSLKSLYSLLKNVREGIRATFASTTMQDMIAGLGEAFRAFLGVVQSILPFFRMLLEVLGPAFTLILRAATMAMKVFSDTLNTIARFLKPIIDYIVIFWQRVKAGFGLSEWFRDTWAAIREALVAAWDAIKRALEAFLEWEPVKAILAAINAIIVAIIEGIKWLIDKAVRFSIAVNDAASPIIDRIKGAIEWLTGRKVEIPITARDETSQAVKDAQDRIDSVRQYEPVPITVIDGSIDARANIQAAIDAVQQTAPAVITVSLNDQASEGINAIANSIAGLQDRTVTVTQVNTTVNRTVNESTGQATTTTATTQPSTQAAPVTSGFATGATGQPYGAAETGFVVPPIVSPVVGPIDVGPPANNLITTISESLSRFKDVILGGGGGGGVGFQFLASGGVVTRPTAAIVGEAGPEAVIPLSQLGAMGPSVGTVVINVSGYEDGAGAGAAAADAFRRALGLQRRMPFATV